MEFVCPVCKVIGSIPGENLEQLVTKTTCQTCGAILLINPKNGNVDAHKAPLKDSLTLKSSNTQSAEAFSSILSMHQQDIGTKDWPAIAVIVFILIVLIAAGIFLL
jgi:hypothetical protein